MAGLFGNKKSQEKTIVIVDVENGSVGAALVRLSPHQAPKLFGQTRHRIPLFVTHDAHKLSQEIERAAKSAITHAQEVAARVRVHAPLSDIGTLERGMVFLHAPWSGIQFENPVHPEVTAVESFLYSIHDLHAGISGNLPLSFHSFGASAAPLLSTIYAIPEETLVCSVSSEMTELFIIQGGVVAGYGTMPFGTHTLLRTLKSHAGLSMAEAYSAMQIAPPHAAEAFAASAHQLAQEFADTARELVLRTYPGQVFVIAHEPFATWFAQALTHEQTGDVFAQGGVVRAVRPAHVSPFIASHGGSTDLPLMLGSLFADARFGSV